jgi:hypothetical protein
MRAALLAAALTLVAPVSLPTTILPADAPGLAPARLIIDSVRHELTFELAPIHIAAAGADMHMSGMGSGAGAAQMDEMGAMAEITPRTMVFGVDGWLAGYSAELVDSTGTPLPHRLIHHVNLIIPHQRELFSPIMLRIGAVGAETPRIALPRLLGFPIHRGDSLLVTAMLNNPAHLPVTGAHLVVRIPYVPANTWWRPITIYPMYLDVMPPAGIKAYDLPAGHSEKSWESYPAVGGRILALGAHLHKYATELRLTDVTTNRVIWRATPVVDAAGEPVDMPVQKFWWRLGIPMHVDHLYRVTAVYDNPTGHAIPEGAMGALGGVMLPDHPEAWPHVDPTSTQYQVDRRVTYSMDNEPADIVAAELPSRAPGRMLTTTAPASRSTETP